MKNPIRSQFVFAFAAAVGLLLAACSGKHENTIVGKWKGSKGQGNEAVVTFTKDGKMLSEEGGRTQNGEYSLSASNTVSVKIDNMAIEFGISFSTPDEMILTPKSMGGAPVPGGESAAAKFTRVSQ